MKKLTLIADVLLISLSAGLFLPNSTINMAKYQSDNNKSLITEKDNITPEEVMDNQIPDELYDVGNEDQWYISQAVRRAVDNILKSGVPTQVKVIYGKQGLIYLDTSYQYDFITKEDVKDKVISYDTAVNIAMTKYDYVSEQNIIRAELQYIPQVTGGDGIDYNTRYEIAPYWVIVIEIPSVIGENASKNEIIFVNAIDKTVYKDTFSNVIR